MWQRATYPMGVGLLFALSPGWVSLQAVPPAEESQAQEQALRKRVEEYYSLMQLGRWSQAEECVTEDSRETFRNQQKNPFMGFQVESVQLDPKGQEGTVVVRVLTLTPISPTPLGFARTSHWRRVKGAWYVELPKPDPNALKSIFEAGSDKSSSPVSPPAEELKFKGHRYNFATIQPGQIKVARFPFTNVTDHVVTLTEVATGCPCLRVKTEKKVYKPGESGEIVIEFDPTNHEMDYAQTIVVKTDPGGLRTHLNVTGFVTPRPREAPKGEGAQPPPSPHP